MWLKWLPWRYLIRRAARARGFIDPIHLMTRLYRFAEPSEVGAPVELLRAGVVFHARGLINTRAIQHNLDWIWPYWVQRQFNPADPAFIPRAFSVTHVNLTCRNWTAVGLPDVDRLPIVDPAGLLTPYWDGWSLDAWVLAEDGTVLIPSRHPAIRQQWKLDDGPEVLTRTENNGLRLEASSRVERAGGEVRCLQRYRAESPVPGWLVVSLRPYNPEGVSFLHRVELAQRRRWLIEDQPAVEFLEPVERHHVSHYRQGDVWLSLREATEQLAVQCDVGMATAAAMYALEPGQARTLELSVPLDLQREPGMGSPRAPQRSRCRSVRRPPAASISQTWPEALAGAARLKIPDARWAFLYEAALRTLVLHAPGEVYPGPYTYKRFWVRDTAFILNSLLAVGMIDRAGRALPHLLARQVASGYFLSQEGEWDANGEALWILHRYTQLAGRPPEADWREAIRKGARWIARKRLPKSLPDRHAGLLPSGFSAEHLGTNDYYYWDDFWGVAGLRSAADMLAALGEADAASFRQEADDLMGSIERSLQRGQDAQGAGIPASPYRRMDSGAVGSLVAGYPLQLLPPDDPRLLATAGWLLRHSLVRGGLFQDMIHSGINAYLTLHLAQVFLRAGDRSWFDLVQAVADLATDTGQWPEAIHPQTLGGCMGDGQHVWAAAEWALALRNAFVREEQQRLVLASGIPEHWLQPGEVLEFGPAPTPWGPITLAIQSQDGRSTVRWQADWRGHPPRLEIRLGDAPPQCVDAPACQGEWSAMV